VAVAAATLAVVAGCSAVTTEFQKATSDAASTFAAAAQSLTLLHQDKLPKSYAEGSFVNYSEGTEGLEDQLPGLKGAPAPDVVARLVTLTKRANAAVKDPCLDDSCDWAAQVEALKSASDALDKASKAQ
jgi:methylthioribose-1-phosphate isomerase